MTKKKEKIDEEMKDYIKKMEEEQKNLEISRDINRAYNDGRMQGELDLLKRIVEQLLHIELNPKLSF